MFSLIPSKFPKHFSIFEFKKFHIEIFSEIIIQLKIYFPIKIKTQQVEALEGGSEYTLALTAENEYGSSDVTLLSVASDFITVQGLPGG